MLLKTCNELKTYFAYEFKHYVYTTAIKCLSLSNPAPMTHEFHFHFNIYLKNTTTVNINERGEYNKRCRFVTEYNKLILLKKAIHKITSMVRGIFSTCTNSRFVVENND